jgi:glycosyltransferase involved in cell wall biosynthesis
LKIIIIVDPAISIPPIGYGGIERVAELLAKEYIRRNISVTLLAAKGSNIKGCTIYSNGNPVFPQTIWNKIYALLYTWIFLIFNGYKYDMVQNFGRLLYILPIQKSRSTKIMCYQRFINPRNIKYFNMLQPRNLFYSGCSSNLISKSKLSGSWLFIHNPIDEKFYQLNENINKYSPLIFLGRLEYIKGCHIAIEVAKQTNNKLIIAGNIVNSIEGTIYFKKYIEPNIDGIQIIYVGELTDIQKNSYLGQAKALLFPILWEEPFGIVMVESMVCGTPVIAFNRGSVEEVVDENITGFKAWNFEEMIYALQKLHLIDRVKCRDHAIERFGVKQIVAKYLDLYDC